MSIDSTEHKAIVVQLKIKNSATEEIPHKMSVSQPDLVVHDFAICFNKRLGVERCFAEQHLVHADAQRPPVALRSVQTLTIFHRTKDLWRNVVWRANCNRRLNLKAVE